MIQIPMNRESTQQVKAPSLKNKEHLRLCLQIYAGMLGLGCLVLLLLRENMHKLISLPFSSDRGLFLALLTFLAGGALVGSWELLKHVTPTYKQQSRYLEQLLGPLTIKQALFLAVLAALAEEVFLRGALQPLLGVALISMILGVIQLKTEGRLITFMLLILLASGTFACLCHFSQSLYPGIIIHVLGNCVFLVRYSLVSRKT